MTVRVLRCVGLALIAVLSACVRESGGTNQPPAVAAVTISPAAPGTADDLTATATASDPDGPAPALSFAWSRNGAAVPSISAATFPASLTTKDDVISVVVTASDAQGATGRGEASVTVVDSPPVLQAAPPSSVAHGDSVSFQITASDPDGDAVGPVSLAYGPSGMVVDGSGLVTWTADLPLFDRTMTVRWGFEVAGSPAKLDGSIEVTGDAGLAPLRRTGIEVPRPISSSLYVGDLDGDGVDEALIAGSYVLFELSRSGAGYAQTWAYPFAPGDAVGASSATAADLEGDGAQEILFESGGVIVLLDGATRRELARQAASGVSSCRNLVVGDVDGSGSPELVCFGPTTGAPGEAWTLAVLDARTLAVLWSVRSLELGGGNVAVGNVDGDPAREIVAAGGVVIDGATRAVEWSRPEGFGAAVAAGDLDGDAVDEIFAVGGFGVRAYDAVTRTVRWEEGTTSGDHLLVADVGGADGRPELLIGNPYEVEAWEYRPDAATVGQLWALAAPGYGLAGLASGDLNGDGAKEVAFGSGVGSSEADVLSVATVTPAPAIEWRSADPIQLDPAFAGARLAHLGGGATALLFSVASTDSRYGASRVVELDPASGVVRVGPGIAHSTYFSTPLDVADVDGDGADEAILGTASLYDGYVAVLDVASGAVEWSSPPFAMGEVRALTHADLTGDGVDDVVAFVNGRIQVWDVAHAALSWQSADLRGLGVGVAVADVDGDGALEIVAASGRPDVYIGAGSVHVFGPAPEPGGFVEEEAVAMAGASDLLVADCDGDGAPEIYVAVDPDPPYARDVSVLRLDSALQETSRFVVPGTVAGLEVEDLGHARKNLVVSVSWGSKPEPSLAAELRALDPTSGREIWRSPPIAGQLAPDSLGYHDLDGDGWRELAFGTRYGMYVTR